MTKIPRLATLEDTEKRDMEIIRINTYDDPRFAKRVLDQHGCFLVDGLPCEIEIISEQEAIVRGCNAEVYSALIDESRFYTPHITRFYDENRNVIKRYPKAEILELNLNQIQPSQFYVDALKIEAIKTFIHQPREIIIQVMPYEGRYISLDGHTRLYYAVMKGWNRIRAVVETSDDWVYRFVDEARKRGIYTPGDMSLVDHNEYEEKWNRFCDDFFA